jgi:hypothetical protein
MTIVAQEKADVTTDVTGEALTVSNFGLAHLRIQPAYQRAAFTSDRPRALRGRLVQRELDRTSQSAPCS